MIDFLYQYAPAIVICLAAVIIYKLFYSKPRRSHDPIVLDGRKDHSQIIEAGSIVEQRKAGRERGGEITLLVNNHKPGQSFEADLNYRTLQFEEKRGAIKLDSRKDRD